MDPAEIGVHLRGQGADGVHGPALVNPASIGVTLRGPPTAVQASPPLLTGTPSAMDVTMRASSLQPFGQPQALPLEAPSPAPIPLLPPPSPRQTDMNSMQSSGPTSSMVQQLSGSGQVSGQLSAMPQQLPDTNRRSGRLNPMPQHLSDTSRRSGQLGPVVQQLSNTNRRSGQLGPMPQQLPDANRRSGQLNPMPQQLPDNVQVPEHLSFMPQELSDDMRSSRTSNPRPEGERRSVTIQSSRSASVTSEQRRGRGWRGFQPTRADYVELGLRLESFGDRAWRVVDIKQLSRAGFFAGDLIFARP